MIYAKLRSNGTIEAAPVSLPRTGERRLDTGQWVAPIGGLRNGTVAEQEACGYFAITEVAPPTVAATQRADLSYAVEGGRPIQVWTVRAETAEEATNRIRNGNRQTLTLPQTIVAKLGEMETFFVDPDVVTARDQPNNTALTASQQNRYNKAIHTQMRRYKNMLERLARYTGATELLDDISGV
jgi:hypothetical protein